MIDWLSKGNYTFDEYVPAQFENFAGPNGIALVKVWDGGVTEKGWGLKSNNGKAFMELYNMGRFNQLRVLKAKKPGPFAFVMRSMSLVCIDVDGKNGGFEHLKKLGYLPPTLAETSKSGDGYHLFYSTADDWDSDTGFSVINDRVGVEQGIDLRGTGCVYHYVNQRWNDYSIAPLPQHLHELFKANETVKKLNDVLINQVIANADVEELLLLQAEAIQDLAKPIKEGARNNTLFAIGSKLKTLNVSEWRVLLRDRAIEVGLPANEAAKLVHNVDMYSS